MATFRFAAAQFHSGCDLAENLATVEKWAEKAKAAGAHILITPENSNRERDFFAGGKPSKDLAWERSEPLTGTFVSGCRALAKRLGVYLVVGVDYRGERKPVVYIGQLLIGPTGDILHVHKKHVLWDYEYTLFQPADDELEVVSTPIGKLALHVCADQIVPDVPRVLALKGAEVYCNSLNSRGPDEKRVHIPLRAIENGVWHVSSNTVGNPSNEGLLWPWTGGSQVVAPDGTVLVEASEEKDDMIWADICPARASRKDALPHIVPDLFAWRRPELYQVLGAPAGSVPAAAMYGPVAPGSAAAALPAVQVAMMQLSKSPGSGHTRLATEWMAARQVTYAARRGAQLGVLPELFCFSRGEVARDPAGAVAYSRHVGDALSELAKRHNISGDSHQCELQSRVCGDATQKRTLLARRHPGRGPGLPRGSPVPHCLPLRGRDGGGEGGLPQGPPRPRRAAVGGRRGRPVPCLRLRRGGPAGPHDRRRGLDPRGDAGACAAGGRGGGPPVRLGPPRSRARRRDRAVLREPRAHRQCRPPGQPRRSGQPGGVCRRVPELRAHPPHEVLTVPVAEVRGGGAAARPPPPQGGPLQDDGVPPRRARHAGAQALLGDDRDGHRQARRRRPEAGQVLSPTVSVFPVPTQPSASRLRPTAGLPVCSRVPSLQSAVPAEGRGTVPPSCSPAPPRGR
eukprot:TRINITY_DN12740_c0_g1_i1.p1 TRINITY_DN12740_c0_g1~~TRINITY_DN12740_c0_g1_i1.p1  ORF type:complete len:682 (+),score=68.93 TRINITY_DN12740_c0_g1_i1:97-2142(+)